MHQAVVTPLRRAPRKSAQTTEVLEGLLRFRLRKCMALLPKILGDENPKAVHDLRVWTRRLQQVIVTLFTDATAPEAQTMVRTLRRARRALGGWRDCDVLIDLLRRKLRRTRNPDLRQVLDDIRDSVLGAREREMARARRKLAKRKVFTLPQTARKLNALLAQRTDHRTNPGAILASSILESHSQWRETLARASDSLATKDVHAFRQRTKRLRYRIELARDLGESGASDVLGPLKTLQDALGHWHDHVVLSGLIAKALADPRLLLEKPRTVAALLRKLAREQAVQKERIGQLLAVEAQRGDSSPLQMWLTQYVARGRARSNGQPLRTEPPPTPSAPASEPPEAAH